MSKKKGDIETIEIPEFKPEEMPLSCTWIIIGPPASGKCLGEDTPVLMHDGSIVKVQDIKAGDLLMGDDSTPRTVLSTTFGTDKLYRITPSRGEPYVVNEPHVLCLKDGDTVREITAGDYFNKKDSLNLKGYRAKVEFPVNYPVPINPYEYGKTVGFMLKHREYELHEKKEFRQHSTLDERSRLGFLAGFLDSYCGYEHTNDQIRIAGTEMFRNEIMFLFRSLGFECWVEYSAIVAKGTFSLIPTLQFKCKDSIPDLNYSFHIEPIGEGKYYGFELDGNHRFLLGDFTVTHNTSLMENLAYYRKHVYPTARVFIGTEDGYKRFCKIFHPLFVSNYWDDKEEEQHVIRQRKCEMENGRGYPGNYAINIIDDVSDDPKIYKTKLMRGLFKLGSQHWAQLLMIGSQYAIDMPPDVRKSVSYVALGREPEMNERKKLYENFGGLAGSFERFCDLMDQITGDYTFLIFKKRSQSNELEDCVSWFRTKKLGDWKFGCKEYHQHGNARYDKGYVEQIYM